MVSAEVQRLVRDLQAALGVAIVSGQITLNVNEGELQSFETRTYQRVGKPPKVDNAPNSRSQ